MSYPSVPYDTPPCDVQGGRGPTTSIPPACVHELFSEVARHVPEHTAVEAGSEVLTYAVLEARANRLARWLRRQGVGPDVRVGVCAERGAELVLGLLAILKAGGAYVPLDPAYPAERLRGMMEDAGVPLVLVQPHLAGTLPAGAARTVPFPTAEAEAASGSPEAFDSGARPDDLAYVLFTSGSTGRPKGVMVTHRAVVRLVKQDAYLEFRPDDVFLQFVPAAFDVSTFEIWGPLLAGARLVMFPPRTPSLDELGRFVAEHGITTLWLTSGIFHQMVDARPETFRGVRTLLSGGDVLSAPHCRRVLQATPGLTLVNGYGPTEVTCFTTCHRMHAPGDVGEPVSIGRPIANTTAYVLDGRGRPLGVGDEGELFAGGAGVARGYQGRPALTAERFVPDPFSGVPGARLYRTGDAARWRPDGTLEFLGRMDQQVKIRGHRIEPGEIESALLRHPAVREATVQAREDVPGDRRLVAYVVGGDVDGDTLRGHLEALLPAYMVPSAFVALDALPLTPNGKVDRRALPSPAADSAGAYAAPRTPTEELLAGAWAEVLGVRRVGVHDDVFALGAHSLASMRVAARVRDALGVEVSIPELFGNATVAALARVVDESAGRGPQFAPIVPAPRDGPLPLSAAQEGVWIIQQLEPGSRAYHFEATIRIRGALDVELLERALTEIVRRHEVLRTTFPTENGAAVQRVQAPWRVSLPVHDLSALPADEREAAVGSWLRDHFARDFDLSVLPLIRLTLLRLAPDEHVLVDVEHHLVHDGWSVNTLLREMVTLYRAFAAGEPSPLAELEVQFGDYAVWQREWLRGDAARAQLEFWRARLGGGTPLLELPADRPRPPVPSYRGAAPRFHLPRATYEALRQASRREGATLFMTMLAAFQALLARWSGQEDLTVGTAVAARRHRQTEPLIGMFVNMVALRTDLGGDPTFRELLRRVRRTTLDAYANQDVPFEAVVEAVRPERSLSHNPLFQAAFSFHDSARPDLSLPGGAVLEVEPGLGNGSAKFDVNVIVIPHGEQAVGGGAHGRDDITLIWEYAADRFDPPTIERMVGHYRTLLLAAAENPDIRLSDLPLLDPRERRQVVEGWNRARRDPAWEGGVPAGISAWARRTPDALAVSAADGTLTYAQLDARAACLARALRRRGAGPESRVAVCLERGAHAAVAMLAAMKAGAAYLPIDPSYPAERIAWLMGDGGACALVTSSALVDRVPGRTPRLVLVDAHRPEEEEDAPFVPAPLHAESAAYVIYTSGSTGAPKGVVVTHGGLMNLAAWHAGAFGVTPADRATHMASAGFDASAWEVWPYLAAGASVHVVPDEVRADPAALRDRIAADRITLSFVPTPLAEPLLALQWPRHTALRALLTGGDRLRVRPSAALPFRVVNNYGPTESTVVATSGPVRAAGEGAPSIGGPIANAAAYVLDARGRPSPIGVPGELYVGGAGVARGYGGRPGMTAERFVPDPFSIEPGARLYRTGDRVRWRADGEIEFLGRTDQQVKIRGVRLEPGEVEAALLAHHAVREAAVAARDDGPGGETRLVAYLAGTAVGDGVVRAHLRARLPAALVPSAYVWLPRLPLSPNGKVDLRVLPAPPEAVEEAGYQPPRTPAEETLARIWAQVLGRERVGVTDDFFALGGHSLQATQIGSRVREAFGAELPIRAVFEAPTVAALAERIAASAVVPAQGGRIRPLARRGRAAAEA